MNTINKKPTAHIIVGFIGAGKTTLGKKIEAETGAVRFSKDEWMIRLFGNSPFDEKFTEYDSRMASLSRDMALRCLKAGISIVMDEGFWEKELRDEIRNKVISLGGIPKLYYLETPFETMKSRTLKRNENPTEDSFVITEEQFDYYWRFFEPPDADEEFILIKE